MQMRCYSYYRGFVIISISFVLTNINTKSALRLLPVQDAYILHIDMSDSPNCISSLPHSRAMGIQKGLLLSQNTKQDAEFESKSL